MQPTLHASCGVATPMRVDVALASRPLARRCAGPRRRASGRSMAPRSIRARPSSAFARASATTCCGPRRSLPRTIEILPGAEDPRSRSRMPDGGLMSETSLGEIDVAAMVASLRAAELPTLAAWPTRDRKKASRVRPDARGRVRRLAREALRRVHREIATSRDDAVLVSACRRSRDPRAGHRDHDRGGATLGRSARRDPSRDGHGARRRRHDDRDRIASAPSTQTRCSGSI